MTLPVNFAPGSASVASLQFTITVPSGWNLSAVSGAASTSAGKSVAANSSNGTVIVFGLNQTTIGSGDIADLSFFVPSSAASGDSGINVSGDVYSDANGSNVAGGTSTGGKVTVAAPTPPPPPPPPPAPTPAPVINSFSATPTSITSGAPSSLSWSVTGATSLSIDNGVGSVTSQTSANVSPSTTTVYKLTATNGTGSVTQNVTVAVTSAPLPPPTPVPPTPLPPTPVPLTPVTPTPVSPVSITVGSVAGAAGTQVQVPVTFAAGSTGVSSLQFTAALPSGWTLVGASTGPVALSAGKSVQANTDNGIVIVFGLNQTAIPTGVMAYLSVNIPSSATANSYPVSTSNEVYSDANGSTVAAGTSIAGTIIVSGSGLSPLPDPDLSGIPALLPLNATISLTYVPPAGYANLHYEWALTPGGAASMSLSGSASTLAAARAAIASAVSSRTDSPSLGLNSWSLTPGAWTLSIYVHDDSGHQSNKVAKSFTLINGDLNAVQVFPNPWRTDRHSGKKVFFNQLANGSTVKLFTISGHEIRSLDGGTSGRVAWDLKNDSGDEVASGIYLYLIKDAQGNKLRGKLAIIR